MEITNPTKEERLNNILAVYAASDSVDRYEGRLAYRRYQNVCRDIAERYDYKLSVVIAAFAAMSPSSNYRGNVLSTIRLINAHKMKQPLNSVTVSTYNHCRDRAWSYLNGIDFMSTADGPKIRNFYLNIIDPDNDFNVTIDGHAVNIWRGKRVPLKQVVNDGGFNYNVVADDYRRVAKDLMLLPNQLQAITWFTWKRIHRIGFKAQHNLFTYNPLDFWETVMDIPAIAESIEEEGR